LKFVSDKATHGLANSLLVYPKPCLLPAFCADSGHGRPELLTVNSIL